MASITGSTTIDWSGASLDPINVQQAFNEFSSRFNQVALKLSNHEYFLNDPPPTSTFLSITTFSGEIVTVTGSGLDLNNPASNPVVKTFEYINPSPSEVVRLVGTLDFVGNEVVNSLTIGFPGSQQTIIGNIVVSPSGNVSGSITQLQVTFGSTEMTLKGSLVLSGNFDISGTVTQISVLSGTNTILMSGLSLPYHALDSVTTANDLFSVVGSLMPGNDTITYANNSGVGMTFSGGAGNDTITISGPNADTLNGGAGDDILNGGEGDDTLLGGIGNDILNGGAGIDTLNGGDGNDAILIGTAAEHGGVEVINGGAGADVIRFTSTTPNETLVLNSNITGVESVVIGTAAGLTTGTTPLNVDASAVTTALAITGNAGANTLTGTSANDTLNGGAGNDTLIGGLGTNLLIGGTGNDSYVVTTANNVVIEALNAGTDKVFSSSINYTLGANVEEMELTGSGNLNGVGNAISNVLTGNSGVNRLSGLAGNDIYVVQNETDSVVETLNAGIDLVQSTAANFTLAVNVENLTLLGSADINGTGNALANALTGNSGHNILTGDAGNDTLTGGAGDDTLIGGTGNDVFLIGNIAEYGASESLDGGVGSDAIRFTSTTPNETLVLNSNIIGVESVVIGTAAGLTTGTTALNVDASALNNGLSITGNAGANTLIGTSANDTLNGGAGNDTLNGGAGTNTLIGGTGNDSYVVNAATNVVVEALNAGTDKVFSSSINYTLGANVEEMELTGSGNLNGVGNAISNVLTGNSGNNQLFGLAGNDTLTGGAGNDTLNGGAGADNLQGGGGDDLFLLASAAEFAAGERIDGGLDSDTVRLTSVVAGTVTLTANVTQIERVEIADVAGLPTGLAAINVNAAAVVNGLTIVGNNGANVLTGTAQADTISGNAGNDTLNGGAGDDTFDFGLGGGQDLIQDSSGSADKMLFDGGIDPLDLVISRQANDLRIAIHGSSDQVTVQNWYVGTTNRTETIQAVDGQTLLSTQVDQLIQAMAQFTTDTGLSWDAASGGAGDPGQQAQFQGIIAANWQ